MTAQDHCREIQAQPDRQDGRPDGSVATESIFG